MRNITEVLIPNSGDSVQQFVCELLLFSGFLGVFEFKAAAGKKKKKQQELVRIHQWVYTLHGQRGETRKLKIYL